MLALTLLASQAAAFNVLVTDAGDPQRWQTMPIGYSYTGDAAPDLKHLDKAIDGAFEAWGRVPHADIVVEHEGYLAEPGEPMDGADVVVFEPDWRWGGALALASTWTDLDGNVVAFDILINDGVDWATDGRADHFDLQAALTHEVGHVLGLDHSDLDEATMFASHRPAEDFRRALSDDDREGVQFLYGDGTELDPALEIELLSCSTAGGSPLSLWVWLPLVLLVTAGRARASTFEELPDLATVARASDAVVAGFVLEARVERTFHGLQTVYTVAVEQALVGQPASTVEVTLPGGRIGELVHRLSNVPVWRPGDEVVLFLEGGRARIDGVLTVIDGQPIDPMGRAVIDDLRDLERRIVEPR